MNHLRLAAACLVVLTAAVKTAAQPDMEKPNPALATLRAGAWLELGGFDSFEPQRAGNVEIRAVAVSWNTPQLAPPNLTPPQLTPTITASPSPVVVETRPIAVARPIEPIRAVPVVPMQGLTPCDDLTNKARRLRIAAAGCDTDIANGRPSCTVDVTFESPRIPRSLTPDGARAYAGQFETVVNRGSERACAEFGGQGDLPEAPARPIFERLRDAVNTMANDQVNRALLEYAVGGLLAKLHYGPETPWTRALRNHFYLDTVRERIRDAYRIDPSGHNYMHSAPYTLNKRSITENLRLLLRDLIAPIIGANMAYATGSINFRWEQVGEVDTRRRQVIVRFTANDALRLGSQTRIPFTNYDVVPDDAFGPSGPMHTVKLEWQWSEVISF